MTGYFKRMGQLGRAGGARYVRAGPRVPKEPTLEAISLEVPAAGSPPVMGATAAPSSAQQGSLKQTDPGRSPQKPSIPAERTGQASLSQPSVSKPSLKSSPVSETPSLPEPQIQARPSPMISSPPSSSLAPASLSPGKALGTSQRGMEAPQTAPGASSGPTAKDPDLVRTQARPDPAIPPVPPMHEPLQDVRSIDRPQVERELSLAPEQSSEAVHREILAASTPEPSGAAWEQELLLSPEPAGGPASAEPTRQFFADEKSSAPLPTAPRAKPDIEVNIGAISLSLDPEPSAPASPPAAMPAPKPRAGGIWSDGRSLARSYLRRV